MPLQSWFACRLRTSTWCRTTWMTAPGSSSSPSPPAFESDAQTRDLAGGKSAVVGAGKLGLLVAQVLAARGDDVTVVCRSEGARRRVGALGLHAADERSASAGRDLVVEATGAVEGLAIAMGLVRPLGTIVVKSTVAAHHSLDLAPIVIHEISLVGSRCGPFAPALEALRTAAVSVAPLLDEGLPARAGGRGRRCCGPTRLPQVPTRTIGRFRPTSAWFDLAARSSDACRSRGGTGSGTCRAHQRRARSSSSRGLYAVFPARNEVPRRCSRTSTANSCRSS